MSDENSYEIEKMLDPAFLLKISKTNMPFGKYAGMPLVHLPEPYVVWFSQKGFPKGELGLMLKVVYEIKLNGLEHLFKKLWVRFLSLKMKLI